MTVFASALSFVIQKEQKRQDDQISKKGDKNRKCCYEAKLVGESESGKEQN